ncbi:ARC6/PARC6 family protein [Oscillatoria acuminata]|uniref:Plastid division protein CDP1-like IMS domain-containing protein n=1 Tax=Oscillatoria acuminata PCC 6304 TaxID=56110 RepID=K9TNV9_9CYAN|nr:ARC6/PARC6 family protein [Oscillatoria acuminata]AFY83811.1 hypothetical protein Oscil6304_4285 [Oscillatoria acuminata PCC 6304]
MKNLWVLTILLLAGCNASLGKSAGLSEDCPNNPPVLDSNNVTEISVNSGTITESGQLRKGQSKGYTFQAESGQKLSYQTKQDICIWLYSPDTALLTGGELPKTGKYTLQVSSLQGSTTFDLDLSLGNLANSASNSSPTEPVNPSNSQSSSSSQGSQSGFTQEQATQIIQNWLNSKGEIFSPPFNRQLVGQYADTNGPLYRDITKSDGSIAWLSKENYRYVFRASNVTQVLEFSDSGSQPFLKVKIYEDRTLYGPRGIDHSNSGASTKDYVYFFSQENGNWKIYDYQSAN